MLLSIHQRCVYSLFCHGVVSAQRTLPISLCSALGFSDAIKQAPAASSDTSLFASFFALLLEAKNQHRPRCPQNSSAPAQKARTAGRAAWNTARGRTLKPQWLSQIQINPIQRKKKTRKKINYHQRWFDEYPDKEQRSWSGHSSAWVHTAS